MLNNKLYKIHKRFVYNSSLIGFLINPFYISRSSLYRHLKSYSKQISGGNLLDVGCGIKPYEKLFVVDTYNGIDIKESGHDHSLSKVDLYFDGEHIPYENSSYDYVISTEVFEHCFNLDSLLCEIRRVLKKNGELFFTVPFCWNEHEVPYDFARYSQFGLKCILEKNGFEIIEIKKSTTFIETLLQLFILYIYSNIFPRNRYLKVLLVPIIIMPITLFAKILTAILPDDKTLPLNLIVRAKVQ